MEVKAVLFDIDDTLYDHKQWLSGAFFEVGKFMEAKFGLDAGKVRDSLLSIAEIRTSASGDLFNILLRKLGILESKNLIAEMVEAFYSYRPTKLELYPGMLEVLRALRRSGKKLGIVSDGRRDVQIQKLEALGILDFFDVIVISDEYGREKRKPSTFPYEMALRKLAVRPQEAVYVGDNPNKDFLGAKKLGMKTVRLLLGEYKNIKREPEMEADFSAAKPEDILEILGISLR